MYKCESPFPDHLEPMGGRVVQKKLMRFVSLALLAVSLLAVSVAVHATASNRQADVLQTSRGELRIMPLYHGSVMLEFGGIVIHVDPWSQGDYTGLPPADLIISTHTHRDHLDRDMMDKLKKPGTIIVGPPAVIDTLNCAPACGQVEAIGDTEKKTVLGIEIEGVPMYNLVRGSAPGKPFHHKGVGSGYVLNFGDTRVYFLGGFGVHAGNEGPEEYYRGLSRHERYPNGVTNGSSRVRGSVQAENCVSLSLSRVEA